MWKLWTGNEGQGLAEYSLILGLVALLVVTALGLAGGSILALYNKVIDGWPQ